MLDVIRPRGQKQEPLWWFRGAPSDRGQGGRGHELPAVDRAGPFAVPDQDVATEHRRADASAELPAVPEAVVTGRVELGQREPAPPGRVDQGQVGVAADGDRPLARVDAEQLGRVLGGEL